MIYVALHYINPQGVMCAPGDVVEIQDPEVARRLIAKGALLERDEAAEAEPEEPEEVYPEETEVQPEAEAPMEIDASEGFVPKKGRKKK